MSANYSSWFVLHDKANNKLEFIHTDEPVTLATVRQIYSLTYACPKYNCDITTLNRRTYYTLMRKLVEE